MDGLPSGWGIETGVIPPVKSSKCVKRRAHKNDTKKTKPSDPPTTVNVEKLKESKRQKVVDVDAIPEGAPSKKHKSSTFSLVSAALSPLVIPYVKDEDIVKWRNRDSLSENEAIIKASYEILVSALQHQNHLQKDRARLEELEKENHKLSKQIEDRAKDVDKLKSDLKNQKCIYESQMKTEEEVRNGLSTTIDELRDENTKLKAQVSELVDDQQNGWAEEKRKFGRAQFNLGFRNYASGFLSHDPDYDFSKFGEETLRWIAKFKVDEAADIRRKRIELGYEAASPEDEEDQSPLNTIQPSPRNDETIADDASKKDGVESIPDNVKDTP